MKDIIAKLEAATEGSRELDAGNDSGFKYEPMYVFQRTA